MQHEKLRVQTSGDIPHLSLLNLIQNHHIQKSEGSMLKNNEQQELFNSLKQYQKEKSPNQLTSATRENQLLLQIQQLKLIVQKQRQEFWKKELELQEQLLQKQQEQDKLIQLTKKKYEIIIDELQSELRIKNEELSSLQFQLKLKHNRYQSDYKYVGQTHSKKTSFDIETDRINTQRSKQLKYQQCETNPKCFSVYNQEKNNLRIKTAEFSKLENDKKNTIKEEIHLLKHQKQLLKQLLIEKEYTDRKNMDSNRKSQSPIKNQSSQEKEKGKTYFNF